jgi:hypothetical protein
MDDPPNVPRAGLSLVGSSPTFVNHRESRKGFLPEAQGTRRQEPPLRPLRLSLSSQCLGRGSGSRTTLMAPLGSAPVSVTVCEAGSKPSAVSATTKGTPSAMFVSVAGVV